MTDVIKLLPDHVANQIAAGEVVQRPSSVVKELLENALDAGATHIKLIVKDGGKTLIQVIDDGCGMSTTDVRMAFERHATSKITSADDLFQLHTKGFRGEALASIAAIAHVEVQTKQEQSQIGTKLKIEGSSIVGQEPVATIKGTSIAVKNLFFNIPARRKFLKSDQVEFRHVIDEFHRVALIHPQISFDFYHNGNLVFQLKTSRIIHRIANIFGSKMEERLVPVTEDTPIVKISGYVVKPQFARKSRGEQFFFANHRFIKSAYLHHAVNAAFEGLIKPEAYAGYFISLEVAPETIDINIHPTKTEVKFDDEHAIYALLRSCVKHSLGQFNVAPVLDFERNKELDTPYHLSTSAPTLPKVTVDPSFNPFKEKSLSVTTKYKKDTVEGWPSFFDVPQLNLDDSNSADEEEKYPSLLSADTLDQSITQVGFQLANKYIVSKVKSGLLIIDQQRAHQRILFERYLEQTTLKKAAKQPLLFPVILELSQRDRTMLESLQNDLEATGFVFDFDSGQTIKINAVPLGMKTQEIQTVIEGVIENFLNGSEEINSFSQTERLCKILSKKMSIKTGDVLGEQEQNTLIHDLFACKESKVSPFLQPIFTLLTLDFLNQKMN